MGIESNGGGFSNQQRDGVLELGALHADFNRLRLGGLQLGLGLEHVRPRSNAAGVSIVGQVQRFLKVRGGCVEELSLRVEGSQLKIVLRQFDLGAEEGGFEIRGAGLRARLTRLHKAVNAPPDIYFPGDIDGQRIEHGRKSRARAACNRRGQTGVIHTDADGHRWKVRRSCLLYEGARLAELCFGNSHVLIGDLHLFFESIQLRVTEHLPPVAAESCVLGLRHLPGGVFLVRRRALRRWASHSSDPPCMPLASRRH